MKELKARKLKLSMEEDWEEFRDAVLKCATEVCEYRLVGRGIRKWSEWWNGKVN